MKKPLLCLLGLTVAFPLAIAPAARAYSSPAPIAQAAPQAELSLVDAFAPPLELPVPTQYSNRQMDGVSRELILAALREADQIQDPVEKTEALLALHKTYRHFELASAYDLLAIAEQVSRQITSVPERFKFTLHIAEAYRYAAIPSKGISREAAMREEALTLLHKASPDELMLLESYSSYIYDLGFWYGLQGDAVKANWLRHLSQLVVTGQPARGTLPDDFPWKGPFVPSKRQRNLNAIKALRAAIKAEGAEALDEETINRLRQMLSEISEPRLRFYRSIDLAHLFVQTEQFELARDFAYETPFPEESFGSVNQWGLGMDETFGHAIEVIAQTVDEDGMELAIAFVEAFPASDPNVPGLQVLTRMFAIRHDIDAGNTEAAQQAIDEAIKQARRLENKNHKAPALMLAAAFQAQLGQGDNALALVEEAVTLVPTLAHVAEDTVMYVIETEEDAANEPEESGADRGFRYAFVKAIEDQDLARSEPLVNQFEAGLGRMKALVQLAGLQSQHDKPEQALRSMKAALTELELADLGSDSAEEIQYGLVALFLESGGSITLWSRILALLPEERVDAVRLKALDYLPVNYLCHRAPPDATSKFLGMTVLHYGSCTDATREVLGVMAEINLLPNSEARTELWNRWFTKFAYAGAWMEAMNHVAQLPSGLSRVEHLIDLAETYSRQKSPLDVALQLKLKEAAQSL